MKRKIVVGLVIVGLIFTLWKFTINANENDDWPMFGHDPQHTGYSKCVIPRELELLWKQEVHNDKDSTLSSPIVAEGKIYIRSIYFDRGAEYYYISCFSADTGNEIWKYEIDGDSDKYQIYIPLSSPAIVAGKVYIGSSSYVYCFDAEEGGLIWKSEVGNVGYSSPVVTNSKVYIGHDTGICCLDARTGEGIWEHITSEAIISTPGITDNKVFIGSEKHLYCLDAATGTPKCKIWADVCYHTASPTVAEDKVYFGLSYSQGGSNYHEIRCGYCFYDGALMEVGVVWNYEINDKIYSSPTMAYGKIYFTSPDYLYCLDAEKGFLNWKYEIDNWVTSSLAIADNKVFVGSEKYIYYLDATTGKKIWEYETEGRINTTPAIAYGRVYVVSNDGYIYCFGAKGVPLPTTFPSTTSPTTTVAPITTSPPPTTLPPTTIPSTTSAPTTPPNDWDNLEILLVVIGILLTGVGIIIAIVEGEKIQNWIKKFFKKNKLSVELDPKKPFMIKKNYKGKYGYNPHDYKWIIIKVKSDDARECRGILEKIEPEIENLNTPCVLEWFESEKDSINFNKGETHSLSVAFAAKAGGPDYLFIAKYSEERVNQKSSLPVGTYIFTVKVTSQNYDPVLTRLKIEWNGNWDELKVNEMAKNR